MSNITFVQTLHNSPIIGLQYDKSFWKSNLRKINSLYHNSKFKVWIATPGALKPTAAITPCENTRYWKLCELCHLKLKISLNKFLKCLTQKKVIEHKADHYYQNRFNNNGYFLSSDRLFLTYRYVPCHRGCMTFIIIIK